MEFENQLPSAADHVREVRMLLTQGRISEASELATRGLGAFPDSVELRVVRSASLRAAGRIGEAAEYLRQSLGEGVSDSSVMIELGRALLDAHRGAEAVPLFTAAADADPRDHRLWRLLGVAHRYAGDLNAAVRFLERAINLQPKGVSQRIDLAGVLDDMGQLGAALDALQDAVSHIGRHPSLLVAIAKLLRRAGEHTEAQRTLEKAIRSSPSDGALFLELAKTVAVRDRISAIPYFNCALRLQPKNRRLLSTAADNFDRVRGPLECDSIGQGLALALQRLHLGGSFVEESFALSRILRRMAYFDEAQALGSLPELGAFYADTAQSSALHSLISQVSTLNDRRHLVDLHRRLGASIERREGRTPYTNHGRVDGGSRIRIGFMSSDLRNHPVAYFAAPVILGLPAHGFDVYCYSWSSRPADAVERTISEAAAKFVKPGAIPEREAARLIADDRLDVLLELGGSTDMNRYELMAWKPCPRQASWLGYPHSTGLSAIDRIIVDPYVMPAEAGLLLETPLCMPRTWVAADGPGFSPAPAIQTHSPESRNGYVTFGTMNNPLKYNLALIQAWAAVLHRVPASRFLFVRPECGVPAFRRKMCSHFQASGIDPGRLAFTAVRGAHLKHYNRMDVSLDTFPQTGGTTTCESIWMGVPVVTLVGPAFFERLSYSNLSNSGLGDFVAATPDAYTEIAVRVAFDRAWRTDFRNTVRQRMTSHPLGDVGGFVAGFAQAVKSWMEE